MVEINELSITLVEELLDEDIRSYDSSTNDYFNNKNVAKEEQLDELPSIITIK